MTDIMNAPTRADFPRLHIDTVIAEYGIWAVLLRVLRAMLKANRPPPATGLSDHLRRDIGLPPSELHSHHEFHRF